MRSYRRIRFGDDEECDLLQTSTYFQFYLDMAVRGAATGFSRLYTRYMNQQPIAVVWGLVHRGHFLVLLTGFDVTGYKNKSIGSIAFGYRKSVGTGHCDSPTVKSRTSCPSSCNPRARLSITTSVPP